MHVDKTAYPVAVKDFKGFDLDSAPIRAGHPPFIALRWLCIGVLGLDLKETDLCAWLNRQGVSFSVPSALLVPNDDFGHTHTL